jgi:hypothetical protein
LNYQNGGAWREKFTLKEDKMINKPDWLIISNEMNHRHKKTTTTINIEIHALDITRVLSF